MLRKHYTLYTLQVQAGLHLLYLCYMHTFMLHTYSSQLLAKYPLGYSAKPITSFLLK